MLFKVGVIIGWVILIAYVALVPQALQWKWVAVFIGIHLSITSLANTWVKPHLPARFTRDGQIGSKVADSLIPPTPERAVDPFLHAIGTRPLLHLIMSAGEEGLFFVPVLLIGVNWYTSIPFALLFGLAHYKFYTPYDY